MEIRVRGKHRPVPKPLQQFASAKLSHLGRFLKTITTIDVELYRDGRHRSGDGQVARVTVSTAGPVFRARAVATDFTTAVDVAYERLERKLKEFKRKRSGRPPHSRTKGAPTDKVRAVSPY
jgi:ribosomal subunit interface protein